MDILLPLVFSLLALPLLSAAPASAQPPAPIVAVRCDGGVTSIEMTEHAAYDATFRNTTSVAANDIHVAIPYGRRRVATFDVRMAFPPHADVSVHLHEYLSGGLFAWRSDDNACNVRYVHFVDGTTWGDPNAKS